MSHLQPNPRTNAVSADFKHACATSQKPRKKRPAPISLRLNDQERAALTAAAADMPLGTYIKAKVFDGDLKPRRTRGHHPVKDHKALAQALGLLGNLRLANNLNQLAKAANMGALPLSPEVEEELMTACAAVLAIRMEIMRALGYDVEGDK